MEILTANELLSGAVVYASGDGLWQQDINRARVFGPLDTEARDGEIARAKASGRLVGIEIEKVARVDGVVIAERLRERIRAEGTTAPRLHVRQELGDTNVSV